MPYGNTPAIRDALLRRQQTSARRASRNQWFLEEVQKKVQDDIHALVVIATEYLKTRVIKNISIPVDRVGGRVTQRSLPGEFPRADTTMLMKTIFTDYKFSDDGTWAEGYVGTPLDYGVILELFMERSFLNRTLNETMSELEQIFERGSEMG